jgi:hypothetical protein
MRLPAACAGDMMRIKLHPLNFERRGNWPCLISLVKAIRACVRSLILCAARITFFHTAAPIASRSLNGRRLQSNRRLDPIIKLRHPGGSADARAPIINPAEGRRSGFGSPGRSTMEGMTAAGPSYRAACAAINTIPDREESFAVVFALEGVIKFGPAPDRAASFRPRVKRRRGSRWPR